MRKVVLLVGALLSSSAGAGTVQLCFGSAAPGVLVTPSCFTVTVPDPVPPPCPACEVCAACAPPVSCPPAVVCPPPVVVVPPPVVDVPPVVVVPPDPVPLPSGAPAIFYTDVVTGPTTGGEGGLGTYLTLFGRGFGAVQGTSQVTVGGVPVAAYKLWSDTKIAVQLGAVSAGALKVIVGGVDSNSNLTFMPVSGKVYFVALTGSDTACVAGDITKPCRTIQATFDKLTPGDHLVVRGGTWSDVYPTYGSFFSIHHKSGTAAAPMAFMCYPGEVCNLVRTTQTRGIHMFATTGHVVITGFHLDAKGRGLSIAPEQGNDDVRVVANEVKNYFEDSGGAATIEFSGTRIRVLGNNLHDNGGSKLYHAIYGDCRAAVVDDNEVAWNTISNQTGGRGVQFYCDTDTRAMTNIFIHDNLIHDVHLDGIILSSNVGVGARVLRNTVYRTGNVGLKGPSLDAGESGGCLRFASSKVVAQVARNTFVDCGLDGAPDSAAVRLDNLSAVSFTDNIVVDRKFFNAVPPAGFSAAGNVWFGAPKPALDATGLSVDPLFVNRVSYDLRLTPASPTQGKGAP